MINNKQTFKKHNTQTKSLSNTKATQVKLRTGLRAGGGNFGDIMDMA